MEKIDEKENPCIVGLDPYIEHMPKFLREEFCDDSFNSIIELFLKFNKRIIDSISEIVPAVKPQISLYEKYGSEGVRAFERTVRYAKEKDLIVILDAKRNDIGSTANAYAEGFLGKVEMADGSKRTSFNGDFMTVNPYLGHDGISPFLEVCEKDGKGIFILVKTSNPSSGDFQDKELIGGGALFERVAEYVGEISEDLIGDRGYSSVGAVAGATYPKEAEKLRELMPKSIFLVPGYGAQGGGAEDTMPCFNEDGYGAVINSSRGILYAYKRAPYKREFGEREFHKAAGKAAEDMREDVLEAMRKEGKIPW